MRPPSYKIQDGCHNCGHCEIIHDYDQDTEYYCNAKAEPRPRSGSVAMKEGFTNWQIQYFDWNKWKIEKRVESYGKCDNHLSHES